MVQLTSTSKPNMKALTKSAPFCTELGSSVSFDDYRADEMGAHTTQLTEQAGELRVTGAVATPVLTRSSTLRLLRLSLICSLSCSTIGVKTFIQFSLRGV